MKKGFLNKDLKDGLGDRRSDYSLKVDSMRRAARDDMNRRARDDTNNYSKDGFALGSGWKNFNPENYRAGKKKKKLPYFTASIRDYYESAMNQQPKNVLVEFYGNKASFQLFEIENCFMTWSDTDGKKWTSVFFCPIYSMKFMSGKLKDVTHSTSTEKSCDDTEPSVEVVWYSSMEAAEDAAAANLIDYLSNREWECLNLCEDTPYKKGVKDDRCVVLPLSAPWNKPLSFIKPEGRALLTGGKEVFAEGEFLLQAYQSQRNLQDDLLLDGDEFEAPEDYLMGGYTLVYYDCLRRDEGELDIEKEKRIDFVKAVQKAQVDIWKTEHG